MDFVVSLKADLATLRALYAAAADRGDRPAMHRLEAGIASTVRLLARYGVGLGEV